jgi:hypothetical protein
MSFVAAGVADSRYVSRALRRTEGAWPDAAMDFFFAFSLAPRH